MQEMMARAMCRGFLKRRKGNSCAFKADWDAMEPGAKEFWMALAYDAFHAQFDTQFWREVNLNDPDIPKLRTTVLSPLTEFTGDEVSR